MEEILVACGQITWHQTSTPPEQILAEIAQAGYDGAPASSHSADETRRQLEKAGLKAAPGYLGADLWDPEKRQSIVSRAEAHARAAQELGCTELYVAASLTPERRAVAGHVTEDDALPEAGFQAMADMLNSIGETTVRYGVRACFHNHVGSYIETRTEIDRLFSLVDRSLVFQGPDLGHLAWAGDDVLAFCRDYAGDIKTLHVKDINREIRDEGAANGWDYDTFSDRGIFIELGRGFLDFPTIFGILAEAHFSGWVVVETDVPHERTPLESATTSRNYLQSIGI